MRKAPPVTPAGLDTATTLLADSQVFCGRLAAVFGFLVTHLCTLVEAAETGSFNGRDVHENILATIVRLNKAIALGRVKPANPFPRSRLRAG